MLRMPDEGQLTSLDCYDVVKQAIFPFDPGRVTAWSSELRDFTETDLVVEVDVLRGYPFKTSLSRRSLIEMNPYDVMRSFYKDLFNHYRYRPALPVDDHIVLGEN